MAEQGPSQQKQNEIQGLINAATPQEFLTKMRVFLLNDRTINKPLNVLSQLDSIIREESYKNPNENIEQIVNDAMMLSSDLNGDVGEILVKFLEKQRTAELKGEAEPKKDGLNKSNSITAVISRSRS